MQFREFTQSWLEEIRYKKLHQILKKIKKEIDNSPDKISSDEKPKNIVDIKIVEDGSVRMYLDNSQYPVRYYPDVQTVNIIAIYKRLLPLLIRSLEKQSIIQKIITVWSLKINFNMLPEWLDLIFSNNYVLLKEEHWSQPTKEIRRILKGEFDDRLVDAISLIVEYDSAYRYRFQDVIVHINNESGQPTFESVLNIFDILTERDYDEMKKKWQKIKKFIKLLFILRPSIKNKVLNILKKLNINEVKMSVEDRYWTDQFRHVYRYGGLTVEKNANNTTISI